MGSVKRGKVILWAGQVVLVALLIWFVSRTLVARWDEFQAVDIRLNVRPWWIILAAVTVWLTYGLLIEAWRRVLIGWNQTLRYGPAMRIWCLSNLGRYLPGKVWSLAGMAVLANRAGVAAWAAGASALVLQALAIGTGIVVSAIGAPGSESLWKLGGAFLLAALAIAFVAWAPLGERLVRMFRPGSEFRALSGGPLLLAVFTTTAHWFAYGGAFWMLGQGLFESFDLSLMQATGAYAAGYIVGLIAVFAPGGVGVRELVLSSLLAPIMGPEGAVALSLAARVLTTVTEAGAAVAALAVNRRKEETVDGSD